MRHSKLRIVVGGLLGRNPVGGWHYMQYLAGLARLGHDVCYHEDTWSWPYHPLDKTHTSDGGYSAKYISKFIHRYAPELDGLWHYLHLHEKSYGMAASAFEEKARTADLFLNVGGAGFIPQSLSPRCVKVFIDTDPGYNQIVLSERFDWSENVDRWYASVAAHDQHFTYAQNIHGPDCLVPKLGFDWKTTRPPVVLSFWQSIAQTQPDESAPWTTIMTWNDFKGRLVYDRVEYSSKGTEFEKLMTLPGQVAGPFRVAVGGKAAPLERLAACGWEVVDGPDATLTPRRYQKFIEGSRGEVSTAKQVYVAMRTGWFSERSTCYLASGRPLVIQDTGFCGQLPTGEGIVLFRTGQEAAAALRQVENDYVRHAKAAREIAGECFDSDKVLSRLIENVYLGHGAGL